MPLTLLPIIFSGSGSNLYPLCDPSTSTSSASKALLPVANRPLIAFALQNLLSTGLTSCLLLAPSSQHAAISKALSSVRLVPPFSPAVSGDKRKARETKEEKKTTSIAIVDSLSLNTIDATTMKVELLPLGPYDGKSDAVHLEGFRRSIFGTAELLRWVASLGKLEADPLVMPIDMINPSMPLNSLINLYVNAQASIHGSPTACCALYERAAGDGTGRERERDGPPRMISAYAVNAEEESRLLILREADLSEDMTFRRSLLQAYPQLRLSTRLLDSHAYILNRVQVIPLLEANPTLTSLREHVLPLIAKASWMKGLKQKANWSTAGKEDGDREAESDDESISKRLAKMSKDTTLNRQMIERSSTQCYKPEPEERSNELGAIRCLTVVSRLQGSDDGGLPRFVARANTVPTYLECNRWLLKALSQNTIFTSTFAIPIVMTDTVEAAATTPSSTAGTGEVMQAASAQISNDSIIGVGVRIGDRASIKRTVVGNRCEIARGARLAGCVLLDGSRVMENARLENVIVCAGAVIGERSTLKECDVGPGVSIAADTNAKNEKLVGDQMDGSDDDDDGEDQ
ncbi:hypothetical protein CBS101457_003175 [Exobasidium rhododendri]|nr:hypothetical protein CBS101457_003175 [Exobasidium rhododendri]